MTRFYFNTFWFTQFVTVALVLAGGRAGVAADGAEYKYEYTSPTAFHQPVPPLPADQGFVQHHASTAAEGYLRGKAAVIHALGNFQLAQSQAAILFEQGRALDRENDLKQTEALLAQQAMWREGRYAKRAEFAARRAAGRAKIEARRQVVHRAAYQLSPAELDRATGEIRWPVALQGSKFSEQRSQMEELMRRHVGYGEAQGDVAAEIVRLSEAMARSLRSKIRTLEESDYLEAQKFLLGLKVEASAKEA